MSFIDDVSNSTTRTSHSQKATCFVSLRELKFPPRNKNVCPYGRFGLILGVAGKIKEVEQFPDRKFIDKWIWIHWKEHPLVGTEHLVSHSNSQITFALQPVDNLQPVIWTWPKRKYWTFWWWEFRSDSHLCWWRQQCYQQYCNQVILSFQQRQLNAGILIGL